MIRVLAIVALAAVSAAALPRPAHACGGFFCNRMPMNQSGERIVFAVGDDGTTTTHVQILYSGSAESFAWILPVPSVPEISVGTDLLFEQLEQRTAPRFDLQSEHTGTCRSEPVCSRDDGPWPGPGGWADAAARADGGMAGVTVHLREAVGPYDAAVVSGDDAMELRTWLSDNGYDIPAASLPLIDHYVERRDVFVALKLLADRSTGEIQPIVLRYEELQPCIPIRLTAIATVPDMPITAWVLADRRAVPYNYMAVTPDLDDEQLWLGGASYQTAVTRAVDDAGGRAFVTDYAGEVPSFRIATPSIEDLRTVTDAGQFVRELQARGFTGDAQLLALLLRFVPPPEGDDATSFYNCIVNDWCGSYDAYLASLPFDPNAFVDALTEAIVAPRERADAMLAAHSKLTRLFTTMSAEEMTEDPVFVLREMADVSNVHTATMRVECGPDYFYWSAPQTLVLPSGREHVISAGIPYTGSDAEYCDDVETGLFGPGVSVEVSMRTSEMRASSAGGGGGCTAAPAAPGTGALFAAGVALALVARRRRRW